MEVVERGGHSRGLYHWGGSGRKIVPDRGVAGGKLENLIVMKPAVGFMLPSAGVTPAPSENRKNGEDAILLSGSFSCRLRLVSSRARSTSLRAGSAEGPRIFHGAKHFAFTEGTRSRIASNPICGLCVMTELQRNRETFFARRRFGGALRR